MNTPICDFVRNYAASRPVRMHMPGHKGADILGFEQYDITEIDGADELFAPDGIIAESEKNASALFGAHTLYSAGGSTLCIQAMLWLIAQYAAEQNKSKSESKKPLILAGRNAHRAFVNAAALIGADVKWIFPLGGTFHSCRLTDDDEQRLDEMIRRYHPTALYLTSPDYLGGMSDLAAVSKICKKHGVILAIDNAHGAYLKFLPRSLHPCDLGADICCDSAHKTLPVITGGAYLHINENAPKIFAEKAKTAMSIFGSSSPSYLILQSLDAANARMGEYAAALGKSLPIFDEIRQRISARGIDIICGEPLKITVAPKSFGYDGRETAEILKANNIYPEYYDSDFAVLMLSPFHANDALRCADVICSLPRTEPKQAEEPPRCFPKAAMTPREALLAPSEVLPVDRCIGRVCAASVISCPPAIPLAVCGEIIDEDTAKCMKYYGVEECAVVVQIFRP